jgi:restriction system protein
VARRRKQTGAESLFEGLILLALYALAVAVALAFLLGTIAIDAGSAGVDRLRGREPRGLHLTRGLWFWLRHRHAPIRVETIGELLVLTPTEFEEAIAQSLRDRGYRQVERCGGAGDLGVDITARDPNGLSIAVQCKRYTPGRRVASREIQLFIGMLTTEHKADRGVYVTTSSFTDPARALGKRHGIKLVDGRELARILGPMSPPHASGSVPEEDLMIDPVSP